MHENHPRAHDEDGFTLVEMLAAVTAALLLMTVPLTLGWHIFFSHAEISATSAANARAETVLAEMLNDARTSYQSCVASGSTATGTTINTTTMTLWTPVRSSTVTTCAPAQQTQQVVWTCTAGVSCTRTVGNGSAVALLPGLVSATFTPTSSAGSTSTPQINPSHLDITLTFQPTTNSGAAVNSNRTALTVSGGTDLANFS